MPKTPAVDIAPTIRDRIVELRRVPASELLPNARNWRRHPKKQRRILADLLSEVGYAGALIARELPDGSLELIDGHLRAETTPDQEVPVLVLDVDEAEAAKLLASLDPISALAGADREALQALTATFEPQTEGMRELMTSLLGDRGASEGAPVLQADVPPRVAAGELWSLGVHRLYCGDARDPAAYDAAMGGGMADMLWTDPPYGIGLASRVGMAGVKTSGEAKALGGQGMLNDELAMPELRELLVVALGIARDRLAPGSAVYVAGPSDPPQSLIFAEVLFELGIWRQTLVWAKDRLVIGRSDYQRRHEMLFYGETDEVESAREHDLLFYGGVPGERVWRGGRKQDTVWEFPSPHASPDHPSMKPVGLVARAIRNSSEEGALVLDPFAGSGTTAIAAEVEGRRAALIELDPRYCDAICARWETISGVDAVLLEAPGAR